MTGKPKAVKTDFGTKLGYPEWPSLDEKQGGGGLNSIVETKSNRRNCQKSHQEGGKNDAQDRDTKNGLGWRRKGGNSTRGGNFAQGRKKDDSKISSKATYDKTPTSVTCLAIPKNGKGGVGVSYAKRYMKGKKYGPKRVRKRSTTKKGGGERQEDYEEKRRGGLILNLEQKTWGIGSTRAPAC